MAYLDYRYRKFDAMKESIEEVAKNSFLECYRQLQILSSSTDTAILIEKIVQFLNSVPSEERPYPSEEFAIIIFLYFHHLFAKSLYRGCSSLSNDSDVFMKFRVAISNQSLQTDLGHLLTVIQVAAQNPCLTAEGIKISDVGSHLDSLRLEKVDDASMRDVVVETSELSNVMKDILNTKPDKLFYRILADEGLSVSSWRSFVSNIEKESNRISAVSPNATIVIFVDELNTASCLGLVSEAFLTHSMDGRLLPENLFFVGAINPLRAATADDKRRATDFSRYGSLENENEDYLAAAPYIVKPLMPCMKSLLKDYPNLTSNEEHEFLIEYFKLNIDIQSPEGLSSTEKSLWIQRCSNFYNHAIDIIVKSQNLVRSYRSALPRVYMSIRNLIRATQMLLSLLDGRFNLPTDRTRGTNDGKDFKRIFLPDYSVESDRIELSIVDRRMRELHDALYMTIAVTYMFQLSSQGHAQTNSNFADLRSDFMVKIELDIRKYLPSFIGFKATIYRSLDHLYSYAIKSIPSGLAKTNALMENFYSIVLCSMNRIPLLISGPPGKFYCFIS